MLNNNCLGFVVSKQSLDAYNIARAMSNFSEIIKEEICLEGLDGISLEGESM